LLDEDTITKPTYERLLRNACHIRNFLEAEILLDAFGYSCSYKAGILSVEPLDPIIEKSARLGFIQSDFRIDNLRLRVLSQAESSHGSLLVH
jgi:hypothetical protein